MYIIDLFKHCQSNIKKVIMEVFSCWNKSTNSLLTIMISKWINKLMHIHILRKLKLWQLYLRIRKEHLAHRRSILNVHNHMSNNWNEISNTESYNIFCQDTWVGLPPPTPPPPPTLLSCSHKTMLRVPLKKRRRS